MNVWMRAGIAMALQSAQNPWRYVRGVHVGRCRSLTPVRARWISTVTAAIVLAASGGSGSGANPSSSKPSEPAKQRPKATPTPRTDVASVAARANVPVLCYHQIRPQTPADSAGDRAYIVSPSIFASQMRALDDAGYTPV